MTEPRSFDNSILVSAGEVSGDHYVARIILELRRMGFGGRIYGLCGDESRGAGAESLWASERLQLLGITEVFSSLRDIFALVGQMRRDVAANAPGAIVVVDSPDFHLPLIKRFRRDGFKGKIFYISPPAVWAWRSYRIKALKRYVDYNLPLFSFEHDYLAANGCGSYWVGHPLAGELAGYSVKAGELLPELRNGTVVPGRVIALMPGSRGGEIEQLFPVLCDLYGELESRSYSPVFSVARGLSERSRDYLTDRLEDKKLRYYTGNGRKLMAASLAVAGTSGTTTAEALLLKKYMVVMYRVNPLSAAIGRLLISRRQLFGVPNVLAGEVFYPELIQECMTPEGVKSALFDYLDASAERRQAIALRIDELVKRMGSPDVYSRWAEMIMESVA